ncbi:hypothetical protein CHCC20335_0344 [Bacillus paralicheniformis]|nr:hypothetical protein CHCC20335_0344 [Bacillus paralicheniformis]
MSGSLQPFVPRQRRRVRSGSQLSTAGLELEQTARFSIKEHTFKYFGEFL